MLLWRFRQDFWLPLACLFGSWDYKLFQFICSLMVAEKNKAQKCMNIVSIPRVQDMRDGLSLSYDRSAKHLDNIDLEDLWRWVKTKIE